MKTNQEIKCKRNKKGIKPGKNLARMVRILRPCLSRPWMRKTLSFWSNWNCSASDRKTEDIFLILILKETGIYLIVLVDQKAKGWL